MGKGGPVGCRFGAVKRHIFTKNKRHHRISREEDTIQRR